MKGIIDRIEEGVAVIQLREGGKILIPVAQLPGSSKEGSVVDIVIRLDEKGTEERKKAIREKQEKLR